MGEMKQAMHAEVKSDTTHREISITVSGVPDIDITMPYHKNPRVFRPDTVRLSLVNGRLGSVSASGGLVLKSGAASDKVREVKRWYSYDGNVYPEWLRTLIDEAPQGVTSWNRPAPVEL